MLTNSPQFSVPQYCTPIIAIPKLNNEGAKFRSRLKNIVCSFFGNKPIDYFFFKYLFQIHPKILYLNKILRYLQLKEEI